MCWIKAESRQVEAQGPSISTKESFVRIDQADWKLPGDKGQIKDAHIS